MTSTNVTISRHARIATLVFRSLCFTTPFQGRSQSQFHSPADFPFHRCPTHNIMPTVSLPLVGSILLPNLGGWAGAFITMPNIPTWYEKLNKPNWRPPNGAFGPVWTSLYCTMGYASYRVFQSGDGFEGAARLPLILYGSQLALNWAWTPLFFGLKKMGLSLVEILLLYANVAVCAVAFYEVDPTAGLLMLPYLAWLSLATALNYRVWKDNKDRDDIPGGKGYKTK